MNHSLNAPKAFYAGCRFATAISTVVVIWLALPLASTAIAQQTSPILRIETGMHTAVIRRIAIDRDNRYLVTASYDKTARVWELASGKLLRILRPPLGDGHEGKLYSIAISPDGRVIAVSGYTGFDWDKQCYIYIFDRESGRLLRRVNGLTTVIDHLAYSHDGSRLVSLHGETNGVRVFETGRYSQIFADSSYGSDSYGADFDSAGRLVTVSYDGFVRLYEPTVGNASMRLVTKRKVEGGNRPASASFSPDGSKIVVGFDDSTKVTVVSGRDLSLLFAPDTASVNNRDIGSVAWSVGGGTLFAGGRYGNSGQKVIRFWAEGGRGKWQEVMASHGTIMQILPLRDGGIVFSAADPAFGRLDASGNRTLFVTSAIADYRDMFENFLLSSDGARFQFGYEPFGRSPARFSINDRQLLTDKQSNGTDGLNPPLTSGLPVTDWKNNYEPKFNEQPLKLDQYEMSRSLAISTDKTRFLLGTEFCLRLYDQSGKEIWEAAAPSIAWSVNISGDGRVAAAAFGDGTVRWYRMSDGKELLAFFPHNDRKRWVMWTPSGYYDASAGAEDLIGWHINNGRDAAADFYPALKFRDTAYRPDVVGLILKTLDESLALAKANEESGRNRPELNVAQTLPPVVSILSPADGAEFASSEITVRYLVRSPSGAEVKGIKALVNGRPVSIKGQSAQTPVQADKIHQLQISIPTEDCEISLIAENQYASSEPSIARLKWRGPAPVEEIKPKLYVLAIGVSRYQNAEIGKLNFAAKDARDFADAMVRQKGGIYRDVVIKVLADEQATKDGVIGGLDWIEQQTTSRDVAMVFLSGHGVNDHLGRYFFLTVNANPDSLRQTAIPFLEIETTVKSLAGKVLFFVDTCHSGNVLGGRKGSPPDIVAIVNELASSENGAVVFASSTGNQQSLEDSLWNNGAFTKAVIEGIDGKAASSDTGKITISTLEFYISERVKALTRGRQTPTTTKPKTIQDFPVAVRR